MRTKKKRIPTVEQRIISNLILLGNTPRAAYDIYKYNRFASSMKFHTLNA